MIRLLSALGRFGYPTGSGVLRYIRDDPELMQRATSTSVDPNALGSLLNVALALAAPQLFARRPIFKRGVLFPLLAVLVACLGLTISRGAVAGVAGALLALGAVRYRKLLFLLLIALLLVSLLPWTQGFVSHSWRVCAAKTFPLRCALVNTRMLLFLSRAILAGVGFAGSPDIDTYIGVANVYLIIAEQMGLVGLGAFCWSVRFFSSVLEAPSGSSHATTVGAVVVWATCGSPWRSGGRRLRPLFLQPRFSSFGNALLDPVGIATATTQLVDSANAQRSEGLASGMHSTS